MQINDYDIEYPFEEVGILSADGDEIGMYSGTAHIDQEGDIVGLMLDAYRTDKTNPIGLPKRVEKYYPVHAFETAGTFEHQLACMLARTLEKGHAPQIKDRVDQWHVERAEDSWSPKKDYGTLHVIGGHVA